MGGRLRMKQAINIIFDGPPSHESGRFVEVETDDGKSINTGEWIEKRDGLWVLRITSLPEATTQPSDPADKEPISSSEYWKGHEAYRKAHPGTGRR